MAFGTLLLVLALFKASEFWRLSGLSGSRLVVVVITDQAFYYSLCAIIPGFLSTANQISISQSGLLLDLRNLG